MKHNFPQVQNVSEDFSTGIPLVNLLEALSGQNLGKRLHSPLVTCGLLLRYWSSCHTACVGVFAGPASNSLSLLFVENLLLIRVRFSNPSSRTFCIENASIAFRFMDAFVSRKISSNYSPLGKHPINTCVTIVCVACRFIDNNPAIRNSGRQ